MRDIFRKYSRLFLIAVAVSVSGACAKIHENLPRCEVFLEFVFDHNMEYADAFDPQVKSVDIYVFDDGGKFLLHKHALSEDLIGRRRMSLSDDLELGKYKIITVGGLSDRFRVSDTDGNEFVRGRTTIEQFQLALERTSNIYSDEFPHLWFGNVVEVDYSPEQGKQKVWKVPLIRNTNRFHMVLIMDYYVPNGRTRAVDANTPYTFEIVTPEGAVYSWKNEPLDMYDGVTYTPYFLSPGSEPDILSAGRINTCRLFDREDYKYRLIVRDNESGEEVWNYNLMTLLKYIKPATRPDGTSLPFQEFLDRQGEWTIAILYRDYMGFLAVGVEVNGWILWLTDAEV